MKTLKLLLVTFMAISFGQTGKAQILNPNWDANVLPDSHRINFHYNFGTDTMQLDFWKYNISQDNLQSEALPILILGLYIPQRLVCYSRAKNPQHPTILFLVPEFVVESY